MDTNFIELLNGYSKTISSKVVYKNLHRGEVVDKSLTYEQLHSNVTKIAARLQHLELEHQRIILLIKDSLCFIENFLACLYAKAIPVPVSVPSPNRSMDNLKSIVTDSRASAVIALGKDKEFSQSIIDDISPAIEWILIDDHYVENHLYKKVDIKSEEIAFIQYTSGSTGKPKGVMITHGNLVENEKVIQKAMHLHRDSIIINWLPTYHDMGLIGNILQPLYLGATCVTMLPSAFVQKPYRWLKAITDFKGTVTGAPNFAYDLCVNRITEEQKETLDLSSLEVTFTGSEPVRARTIQRFAECFSSCGFEMESFFPCYGMAESTLFISGYEKTQSPRVLLLKQSELVNQKVVLTDDCEAIQMVSCGPLDESVDVAIVDSEGQEVINGHVGEIWVKSNSVAIGYFDNELVTKDTFKNKVQGKQGDYLKTGDLGFLLDGELYISGRCKDLIIIRGKNYYPNDIELTSSLAHPMVINDGVAAFSVEFKEQEELVLVVEVDKDAFKNDELPDITKSIRKSVIENHDVAVFEIVLIKRGQLPRTTSGKLKRSLCQSMWLDNFFQEMNFQAQNNNFIKAKVSNY